MLVALAPKKCNQNTQKVAPMKPRPPKQNMPPIAKLNGRSLVEDSEFIAMYYDCGQNVTHLAKSLDISRAAIAKRLKKLGNQRLEDARTAGAMAVSVGMSVKTIEAHRAAFESGAEDGMAIFRAIKSLDEFVTRINRTFQLLDRILEQHETEPGKEIQQHHVAMIANLTGAARQVISESYKIKKDISDIVNTHKFIHGVMQILEEEIPDVQTRIYRKLAAASASGQFAAIYSGQGETAG